MDVRGVAGEQHSPVTICGSLSRHVGEPGDPPWIVDPVVGAVHGDERFAHIAQSWLVVETQLRLGQHHAWNAVVSLADCMDAARILMESPFRLLSEMGFCDQPARRRIPTRKLDARRLANQAASAIASDEVLRPE